ncbi:hypothetical protein [Rhizobium sp. NRK18]|nr:hypothetical protein [Rhizobium sp. NRK18]
MAFVNSRPCCASELLAVNASRSAIDKSKLHFVHPQTHLTL